MSQIRDIFDKVVDWIYDMDRGNQKCENGELSVDDAVAKLKSLLLSEAVEVTPVMYRNPINGGMVVGVTNSAIPIEAVNRLFDD